MIYLSSMKKYRLTIIAAIIVLQIAPHVGLSTTPTDTIPPPSFDTASKALTLYPEQYVKIADDLRGQSEKIEDLVQTHWLRDSLDLYRLSQLDLIRKRNVVQDSIISNLYKKNNRLTDINYSYKHLIARRDSIYRITEKRFINQIAVERRQPKGFFKFLKERFIYLAAGLIVGFILK